MDFDFTESSKPSARRSAPGSRPMCPPDLRGRGLRLLPRRPRGGATAARLAAHAVQGRLRGHGLADGVRRARRLAGGAGDLLRGDVAGAGAPAAQPERALHARPHPHEARHRRPEGRATWTGSSPPRRSGARDSPSRTRAATSPISRRAPCSTATATCSMARRCGRAWRMSPTGASSWCAPIPPPPSTRASPSCCWT